MDTYEVLVVLLSISLIGVLITTIFALVLIIKILHQVQRVTNRAEQVVDKVESVGEFFKNAAGISSITRIISGLAESAMHNHTKKKGNE